MTYRTFSSCKHSHYIRSGRGYYPICIRHIEKNDLDNKICLYDMQVKKFVFRVCYSFTKCLNS